MSDMNELLRKLRENPPRRHVPVAAKPPAESPPKPRPPNAGVSSSPEPKQKKRRKRKGRVEEDTEDLVYRTVPKTKTLPRCGSCRNMLHAGEKHWYYIVDGDQFWWCVKCMKRWCKLHPPEEAT